MIGIVLVGHNHLAEEFHNVVKTIVGEVGHIASVYIDHAEQAEASMKRVAEAIKNVDSGEGVLVLTDMFGGTPSNLSLSFLEQGKVEVLTGVNLPMLVKVITLRDTGKDLSELARELMLYGRENICIASELLENNNNKN